MRPLRIESHSGDSGGKNVARRNECSTAKNLADRGGKTAGKSVMRIADSAAFANGGDRCSGRLF